MDARTTGTPRPPKQNSATPVFSSPPPREIRKSLVERARRAGRRLADSHRVNRVA